MKQYKTKDIRNVALVGHSGSGKTTFVERALLQTGVITRMGSVNQGTAAMDFEEEEIARNGSIATSIAPIEWRDRKLNLLDTPGYVDFIGEVNSALRVTEGAMIFVEAVSGVQVGTEAAWQYAEEREMPRIIIVNKMDRDTVRVARVMGSIEENLEANFVRLQLPIGEGSSFKGVVDLFSMESRLGADDSREPIPADLQDEAEAARLALVEAAAEGDDTLLEKYFEEDNLSDEEIVRGLRLSMQQGLCVPVMYSAAESGVAMIPALNALARLMPDPTEAGDFEVAQDGGEAASYPVSVDSPLSVLVFKTREDNYGRTSYLRVFGGKLSGGATVYDSGSGNDQRLSSPTLSIGKETIDTPSLIAGDIGVVVKLGDVETGSTLSEKSDKFSLPTISIPDPIASVAIHPASQSDISKLSQALTRLTVEDPTLNYHTEQATRETILSGMGTTHLDIAIKKAASKFGVNLLTTVPKIPYRETITRTSQADYTHKKQTGGAGQYGRVFLRVESIDVDEAFQFDSEIFGGSVSAPFVSATEKGVRQALEGGVLAGYPIVGVKAVIYDGKMHPVDSKEIAFQIAGRECFRIAARDAGPSMLEPIYNVKVTVPNDNMGDILGDLNTRRAIVEGTDQVGSKVIVSAKVPLAEMQTYGADLRSMTGGRGIFSMSYDSYNRVPNHLQNDLVAKLAKEQED